MAGKRRVLPGRSAQVHCRPVAIYISEIKSAKKNEKTALKQETHQYNLNLSDLKHDIHCGVVELGDSVSVSLSVSWQHHRLQNSI
jgi:hypothetical protein